jgi:hypothetical protein
MSTPSTGGPPAKRATTSIVSNEVRKEVAKMFCASSTPRRWRNTRTTGSASTAGDAAIDDRSAPDLGPTLYNLIDGMVRFLGINQYSPHNTTQPRLLVDLMPEVYSRSSDALLRRLLSRKGFTAERRRSLLRQVRERGSVYLTPINAVYVRQFRMTSAAEDATRFLHQACRGLPNLRERQRPETARLTGRQAARSRRRILCNRRRTRAGIFRIAHPVSRASRAPRRGSGRIVRRDS